MPPNTESHPASPGSAPPPSSPSPASSSTPPPASNVSTSTPGPSAVSSIRWGMRAGIGAVIAIAVFIVLDGLFWPILSATGIVPSGASWASWTPTMYAIWIVVAIFAGAGYTLASLPKFTRVWWAWRVAGGVALAVVLYLILDSQLWTFLNKLLPSRVDISSWPSPLFQVWIIVAILCGARFVLARSRLFTPPWWAWRAIGGTLLALGTYFAAVWLPQYVVPTAQSYGAGIPNLSSSLALVGTLLAVLIGAAYALHPTRAYGPLEIAAGVLEIFYLLVLVGLSPWALSVHSLEVTVGVVTLMTGLVLVILISMSGDVVTTIEDFARPGERRAWQYPLPPESQASRT